MEEKPTKKIVKSIQGVVLRKSGDMTVVVEVSTEERHKLYGKKMKRSKRYLVHDSANEAVVGEVFTIRQIRPISKRKRWGLVKSTK